jgi:hypothetical protein
MYAVPLKLLPVFKVRRFDDVQGKNFCMYLCKIYIQMYLGVVPVNHTGMLRLFLALFNAFMNRLVYMV